jgi:hypothetical protein
MNRRFAATVVAVVLIVIAAYAGGLRDGRGMDALLFPFALLVVLVVVSYRRRMARFRARWASYEIALADDAIAREIAGFPPVRIARAEVASIEELPSGLAVRDGRGRGLVVPRELEGYEGVREALEAWMPIARVAR